jgi:peptidyl-prolyl cis-trans isomerase B (cyclophilin B)
MPKPDSSSASVLDQHVTATIETDKGTIVLHLYPAAMPKTVANFVRLIEAKFYDGLSFHRVEDWVVQCGDPKGDGTGGPGWKLEFETHPELKHDRGGVGMARQQHDVNSAGSQFYIVKTDAHFLDGAYACFGKVASGMDVVEQLRKGDKIISVTIAGT